MSKKLRLAGCIIVDDNSGILLLHRNTLKRTQWEIPGGKIEAGESEIDTVVREIKEELVVDVEIIRLLGSRDFTEDDYTMSYHWFLGRISAGSPAVGEPQTFDDLRYFSQHDLSANAGTLSSNTRNFLEAWKAKDFSLNS